MPSEIEYATFSCCSMDKQTPLGVPEEPEVKVIY